VIVRPLHEEDDRSAFESGAAEPDRFFHDHALTNHRGGISRVYVAVDAPASHEVLGFHALSATSVESSTVRDLAAMSLPRYPMPALLIGQLAVDRAAQDRGIGTALLRHALHRCFEVTHQVAVFGILVDALN
jgi:GNAT superfamily N-acetyltransferase